MHRLNSNRRLARMDYTAVRSGSLKFKGEKKKKKKNKDKSAAAAAVALAEQIEIRHNAFWLV